MDQLKNKVAVVTGASKGIGASIAKYFAAEGAKVVVNYASGKEGAENVVKEITGLGGTAIAVQADVSKEADVARLFEAAKDAFGTLDILVNNAGIYQYAPIEQLSQESFHQQFNINVLGSLLTIQAALKLFGDKGGNIINISSEAGKTPLPTGSVYSATKAALDAITIALSKEFSGRNIRINSILPGLWKRKAHIVQALSAARPKPGLLPLHRLAAPVNPMISRKWRYSSPPTIRGGSRERNFRFRGHLWFLKKLETMSRLKNKVAVITGGNSGIGFGIAEAFKKKALLAPLPEKRSDIKQFC